MTKVSTAQARFSPAPIRIIASNQTPEPGELVSFQAPASLHFRSASLLGREAEVRFTPSVISWVFGDGSTSAGSVAAHAYQSAGTYLASTNVVYLAEYRFAGESQWLSGGLITVRDSISITVGQVSESVGDPIVAQQKKVLLVAKTCSVGEGAFGCSG